MVNEELLTVKLKGSKKAIESFLKTIKQFVPAERMRVGMLIDDKDESLCHCFLNILTKVDE